MAEKPKSRKKLYAGAGVVIVIVIIVAAIVLSGGGRTNIIAPNSTEAINAQHYYGKEFKISSQETLYGNISSTNGVTVYLFTVAQYNSFNSSGSANSYVYTTGKISGGGFNTNLASGTYYLILENTNLLTSTTVTVNELYLQG